MSGERRHALDVPTCGMWGVLGRCVVQGDAGRLIYEFLWDEYADWYIEASKTRMQDPQAAQGTALPSPCTESRGSMSPCTESRGSRAGCLSPAVQTLTRPLVCCGSSCRAAARRVLVYVFDTCLRLLHPYMPYVTEILWQQLPHHGEALMTAPWPQEDTEQYVALSHIEYYRCRSAYVSRQLHRAVATLTMRVCVAHVLSPRAVSASV